MNVQVQVMRLRKYVHDIVNSTTVGVYDFFFFVSLYFQDNCLELYRLTGL